MFGSEAHIFDLLRQYFQHYGYWTVAFMLLLENTGVPVPGEATLLFACFLAYTERQLHLPIIIAVGTAAAMAGDNAGYAIGYFGGRNLLNKYAHVLHIHQETIRKGESFFMTRGALAVFGSRFVAGLRVIAGPLAGALRMPWRRFFLFNLLGAATWVITVSTVGYFFGGHLSRLLRVIRQANLLVIILLLIAVSFWWWKRDRVRSTERQSEG